MNKPTLKIDLAAGEISFQGSILDIASELGVAIGDIYSRLMDINKIHAEMFKAAVSSALASGSPVWEYMPGNGVSIVIPMGGAGDEQHDIH